ncbi:cytochrome c-type biogenesis protein [Pseudobacteriovorax antillogorgiicola]|uniref:Cytochrome c-type biogenesis protein n=1 Tax=Pseudobacteriovorax antillogorgiicola TaxID=1513793 RepID=A0A1Y6B7X9_9BACT|nr:cytochrome c-type biogenesis protein [Pseudobacteriovorax antillogorgiicola]TCS58561.1 cytochrome c-type biogenesis protein CcmH/NrfF [Pseudobacteriovorax antillogorgiicola]SME97602.1 Cytochrome c-type biogenesis protein CcmH/NrfF [Pseudobacteriovorax antillogorgiicola]
MKKLLLSVWFVASLAFGQESQLSDNDLNFKDVAGELRCPTCTGLSVLDSDAKFSVQIKDQVKEQMEKGRSKDEILEFFVERYGPWILREPPKEGFNIVAWIVPIAMLFLGPIIIWASVWRKKVTVDTFGVRSDEKIVEEMKSALERMSKG